jgi:hypothetical protein
MRYAYTTDLAGCYPWLSWCDPYAWVRVWEVGTGDEVGTSSEDDTTAMYGSDFVHVDGRLYRVTGMDAIHVFSPRGFLPTTGNNEF